MKKRALLFLLPLLFSVAHATETDDSSSFYRPMADAEERLNAQVQEMFTEIQGRHFGCDRRIFLRQAGSILVGNLIFGTVEYFANNSPEVERAYTPAHLSIYRGTSYHGGFVDMFVNLGPVVNVAGHHVGTDKLGHFMDMGYDLYHRHLQGDSVADLLKQSRSEEGGLWGSLTTGVKSYGDIASNFDGFRFWREFSEPGPAQYFVCENGRFKQVRRFKWSDYISSAWTEAINCSEYWSESYAKQVAANTAALENQSGRRHACPIVPGQCETLRKHYERWIPREKISEIISPLCR